LTSAEHRSSLAADSEQEEETMGASYRALLIWLVVITVLFFLFMVAMELMSVD